MNRRSFIFSTIGIIASPAIVKVDSLMKISKQPIIIKPKGMLLAPGVYITELDINHKAPSIFEKPKTPKFITLHYYGNSPDRYKNIMR